MLLTWQTSGSRNAFKFELDVTTSAGSEEVTLAAYWMMATLVTSRR
jgi:hypothetical protein